jgi:recA bacterial DNA recombination protein
VDREKLTLDLRFRRTYVCRVSAPPLPAPLLLPDLPRDIAARLTTAAGLSRGRFAPEFLPTRIEGLDRLLGGGLPRGALVEMSGRTSSGRFSVALSALAATTQTGEAAALVDPGDYFDPQGAAAAGAELSRVLWLRPRGLKPALAAAETVLATGFALVILDLGLARIFRRRFDDAVWLRLARRARFHDAALLVLAPYRVTGTAARVVLAADAARACWDRAGLDWPQSLSLLDGLSSRLVLEKTRDAKMDANMKEKTSLLNLSLLDAVQAGKKERKICLERQEKEGFSGRWAASMF